MVRHRWRRRRWDPRRGGGAPRVSDGAERVLHEAPLTVRRTARTRYGRRYWARDGSGLSAWRERPVSAAIAATGWPLLLLSAVPAGLAAVSHDPPKEYPQFEYCPSPSRTAHPVHRCRFIHATGGVCAQSSAPGSKQRPAELQVAAAAEFRRVIVDYLDRNVVEPQTILIEPPDGSANRSDRPVSGTVCR